VAFPSFHGTFPEIRNPSKNNKIRSERDHQGYHRKKPTSEESKKAKETQKHSPFPSILNKVISFSFVIFPPLLLFPHILL